MPRSDLLNVKTGSLNFTPLYAAADHGYTEIVKMLVLNGANPNECISNKTSPLGVKNVSGGI